MKRSKLAAIGSAWLFFGLLTLACDEPRQEPAPTPAPAPAPAPGQARLACDSPVFEFGTVLQGEQVKHDFTLTNPGTAPLTLRHVSSSCGSTVGAVKGKEIPPGGQAPLEVTVDTAGLQGELTKTVSVLSNGDPKRLELKVHGVVEVLAGLEPPKLELRNVLKGTQTTQRVRLVGRELARLKVLSLATSDPQALTAKSVQVDGQPGVEIGFRAGPKPGRFEGEVVLKTDLEKAPEIKLPVRVDVTDDLVFDIEFVDFGVVSPRKPTVKTVAIRSLGGKPFALKGAADPGGQIQAEVRLVGAEHQVVMTAARSTQAKGEVVVKTDRKDQPEVRIPYRVQVFQKLVPGKLRQPEGIKPLGPAPAPQPAPAPAPRTDVPVK